jgi:dihydroorotate dehydrogenase (NAD+) catalytic subunit
MADLSIKIGALLFKNPVLMASGTCGYGSELEDFIDIAELGGIIVKGTTLEPREGNAYPRMAETASGMLNAVGLQNKGIDYFEKNIYPRLSQFDTHVIVNVNGNTVEDYTELSRRLDKLEAIPAIELNISCPNVKRGGMIFGTNPEAAREVVAAVKYPCRDGRGYGNDEAKAFHCNGRSLRSCNQAGGSQDGMADRKSRLHPCYRYRRYNECHGRS